MSKRRKRPSTGPYVGVPKSIWEAPAWREMSPEARLLWIDLRGRLRNDCLNNGNVHRSCGTAAKSLGLSKNTITRRFGELEHYGFLHKTSEGFLGADGRGIAAKYRFTDLAHGTHPATRDYEKWDGELFVYTPRRGGRKKQNPVPRGGTVRPTGRDIRKAPGGGSVCPTGRDIGSAPECPTGRDISRCQLASAAKGEEQGSSTARAPAQAGGAGSRPAPVAKLNLAIPVNPPPKAPVCWSTPRLVEVLDPAERAAIQAYWRPKIEASPRRRPDEPDLTTMVLDIVNAQLDELERRRRKAAALQTVEPAPALAGDRHREAVRNRNREALQRFEQKTQSISGAPQTQQHTA